MSSNFGFFKLVFPEIDLNYPINPEAEIHVRHNGTYHRLTPKFTEPELDSYINNLISDLEQIRQEANRRFASARNRMKP